MQIQPPKYLDMRSCPVRVKAQMGQLFYAISQQTSLHLWALRERNAFYVDKTELIRIWWEDQDDITLITRPRRFGKTLNMSTLNCFFHCSMQANAKDAIQKMKKIIATVCHQFDNILENNIFSDLNNLTVITTTEGF